MDEQWRPVKDYEKLYEISDHGRLRNTISEYILKPFTITHGYSAYSLTKEKEKKQFIAHRLVAQAFLNKFSKDLEVNHKNGIKNDNRLMNLEIVTHLENMNHALTLRNKVICLRCNKFWNPFQLNPSRCKHCQSKLWNVEPTKNKCTKCAHSWNQRSKNRRTTQCPSCFTSFWES